MIISGKKCVPTNSLLKKRIVKGILKMAHLIHKIIKTTKNGESGIRTRGSRIYSYDGLANRLLVSEYLI